MKVPVICANCGKEYLREATHLRYHKGKPQYCGMKCAGERRRTMVEIVCAHCGKTRLCKPAELKDKNYCSKQCANKAKEKPPNLKCATCGKPMHKSLFHTLLYKEHYCSRECRGMGDRTAVDTTCYVCKKVFKKKPSMLKRSKRDFCSHACRHVFMATPESHSWKGGVSFEPYTPEFTRKLKETIRKRDKYTCQICGVSQATNGRALDIHHINYDKKDCRPVNLLATCRSCNIKCNTNRPSWQARLEKYQAGRGIS